MKSPAFVLSAAILCHVSGPLALGAQVPRTYASPEAHPSGPPDPVAMRIMNKPIFPIAVHALAFSPDGTTLATGDGTGRLRLWDPATGRLTAETQAHSNWVFAIAWTSDGAAVVTGGGDNAIRWFDPHQPDRPLHVFLAHSNDVHAVALTRDGRRLFSTGDDRQILAWNVPHPDPELHLDAHDLQIPTLALSPDQRRLASGSRDDRIRLWDARTGALLDTLVGHSADVVSVSFSPDGRWLASGGWDYTARLWDVDTGKAVRILLGFPNWVSSVAFSPDGKALAASSGGRLRLFDVADGEERWSVDFRGVIRPPTGGEVQEDLSGIAFSPDGKWIAVGSTNGAVYLISAETGERVRPLGRGIASP